MAKTLGSELNEPLEPLDPVAAREERRATGRMCAVIVALLMIFSGFYHAWIKRIPVLAGVMVPALIMLLYAAWVLFLAKRDKQRRLNAENHIRSSMTALSDILIMPPPAMSATGLSASALALAERRLSHSSERRLSHSSQDRMRLHPSAVQLLILQQQHQQQLQQDQIAGGRGTGRRGHRKDRSKGHSHHHHHHSHSHSHSSHSSHSNHSNHHGQSRRGSSNGTAAELRPLQMAKRRPSLLVTPPTPQPQITPPALPAIGPLAPQRFEPYGQQRPSLVRSLSAR